MAAIAGVGEVPVKGMSRAMISGVGMFVPMVRELKETYYQFDRPFILDDSETRSILGVEPTDWKIALAARHPCALRPGHAVRQRRVATLLSLQSPRAKHEPQGQLLGQRGG